MSRAAARRSGHVLAIEQNAAGGRQLEPGDHAQRRGLAAAGRPQHDEERAVIDVKFEPCTAVNSPNDLCRFSTRDLRHAAPTPENG